jgi:uncharacterized protein
MTVDRTDETRSVLITGGSGLIGRYLTSALLSAGYKVSHLSRKSNQFGKVRVFRWDPDKGIIDPVIFEGIDYVIHLAGSNIGEKRWTNNRKTAIKSSRINSARLLYEAVSVKNTNLKAFISASATGYYGAVFSDQIFSEEDPPGEDFLATTCRQWEKAADIFKESGARVVKIRSGLVLEKDDGFLAKMLKPARLGIFPLFGTGYQYMPWIHIEDLCNIYIKALSDETIEGPYNAVAPEYVTQDIFMGTLAEALNKSYFNPRIPEYLMRFILGEMAEIILTGNRISARKISGKGYMFSYPYLRDALRSLLL